MTNENNFEKLNVSASLLAALKDNNITNPTEIQSLAIPVAMEGHDILATAQTGTGKTFAYLLPLIMHIHATPNSSALIITPTREIAQQVKTNLLKLIANDSSINVVNLIGGENMFHQRKKLKGKSTNSRRESPKSSIIIGTPGRINDHLRQRSLDLSNTNFLVLDEVDRMLDIGFSEQLEIILSNMPSKEERQTLMFSATMPKNIEELTKKYLHEPKRISVGSATQPIDHIKQVNINLHHDHKFDTLMKELNTREGSVIVFVKTKAGADDIADQLCDNSHKASPIHGDLRQSRRNAVIKDFMSGKIRIMVATDVAARGIDIHHVKHVINYDLPECPEDYVHRIGRTGRAGAEGNALNFITPADTRKWRNINRFISDGESDNTRFSRDDKESRNRRDNRNNRRPNNRNDAGKHSFFSRDNNRLNHNRDRRPSDYNRDERSDRRSSGPSDYNRDDRFNNRSRGNSQNRSHDVSNNRNRNNNNSRRRTFA